MQDTDIQERITEAQDDVARLDLRPFFDEAFLHTAAFNRVEIDDTVRQDLPDNADIIVKLTLLHGGNREAFLVHRQRRRGVAKDEPEQAEQHETPSCNGIYMFLLKAGLALDADVHITVCRHTRREANGVPET